MTLQRKATLISSSVAFFLTLLKLIIGVASGSVAVLASAVDSILDMFVSIFNYFAITNSEKPADEKFNYGRSKIEALASLIEGVIITLSGVYLLYEAISKIITNKTSTYISTSIVIMFISLIVTSLLVLYLNKVAKETNSMLIKADALHYKTDLYSNFAVLISLVFVNLTNYEIIDSIVGGVIALFIIYSAFELIKEGIFVLLDKAIDVNTVKTIEKIIEENEKITNFHFLKTREASNKVFVEVHLVFNINIKLIEAHKISDEIERKIKDLDSKKDWIINIHLDPYDDSSTDNQQ